jgi:hypothetical protein
MKAKNIFAAIILSGTLFLVSCKKENGGPSGFKYKLTTTNRSNAIGKVEGGTINWTSGTAFANEVKFEAKNAGGTEIEYKTSVSQQVDIFASVAQVLGTITLPAGNYSEIEFKAELASSGSGAALELNGAFTSGGTTTPVQFIVNSPLEIKTEQNNVTIADGANYTALTTFDLSRISSGITEAMLNAATRTSGRILISVNSNTSLYNIMLTRLDDCDHVEFEHD